MDAYDIHQTIFQAWQRLATRSDSASINKTFGEVLVYVETTGGLATVKNVKVVDGKIILETK